MRQNRWSFYANLCRESKTTLFLVSHDEKVIQNFDRQENWEEVSKSNCVKGEV